MSKRPVGSAKSLPLSTVLFAGIALLGPALASSCGTPGSTPSDAAPPAAMDLSVPPGCDKDCADLGTPDLHSPADLGALPDLTDPTGMMTPARMCDAVPPPGAKVAAPPPVYAGTCPTLVPGKNTILTSGGMRTFLLAVPSGLDPKEKLPLVFLWHWLGGSADSFMRKGDVQSAVNSQRFLAIAPEAKSDMLFKWPFDIGVTAARQEEEFRFFDDMYACAAEQFNVNNNCVASAGVSAGALFTDQLAGGRSKYLASGISLSGGVDGFVKPWGNPPHKLPMLVLWGGMIDNCLGLLSFDVASKALETALNREGNFLLECVHNCGHAEPPIDAPMGMSKYSMLWDFVFAHPFWLGPGESPYRKTGLPKSFPSWCGLGSGSATARTGMCPEKPGC